MQPDESGEETWRAARDELRRAYLLLGFGNVDEAIEICREVDDAIGGEHHLPGTLEGAFQIAKGELREAIGTLREVTSEFPDAVLPRLHFAEACYLDGRTDQGDRALDEARARHDGDHAAFLEALDETLGGARPEEIPPPVRIETSEP